MTSMVSLVNVKYHLMKILKQVMKTWKAAFLICFIVLSNLIAFELTTWVQTSAF